ncbi:hypothetical protein RclHR1_14610013 [Rhizophagus clarus]|uniref:Uncharacterized protein n=1 Tax=Rhizophagus clarus TaxID=94130 RepID=A0A2Z6QQI8_9GLOM|nr:hypothetical protein RclHR1_14610013 [Rhizophagus clarus]
MLYYASMQSEIDGLSETDSLKQCISELKLPVVTMTGILTPSFHVYYSKQLNQLPRSIKIDTWRRLTSRKHPLSIEQASSIHPEVEDLLNKVVGNYIKQKERQKMKPITSDCETSLRRENEELCISKQALEKKIEELLDLQEQYTSREVAMIRSLEESSGKVTQLSDSIAFFKSIILDTKKAIASAKKSIDLLENKCQHQEDIISAKDRKIIALVDQILSKTEHSDVTIELEIYSSTHEGNYGRRGLERDYSQCEQEIQDLNREIELLENASKEEIVELKSEISSLKSRLYQAKKDVRDKVKVITDLEKRLEESEEQVDRLRCQI